MPEITAPKACIHFPWSFQKKRERCHIVTNGFGREIFTKATESQNENEGLAKKKTQFKNKEKVQTARSVSFRWDVTCVFLDANQSEIAV